MSVLRCFFLFAATSVNAVMVQKPVSARGALATRYPAQRRLDRHSLHALFASCSYFFARASMAVCLEGIQQWSTDLLKTQWLDWTDQQLMSCYPLFSLQSTASSGLPPLALNYRSSLSLTGRFLLPYDSNLPYGKPSSTAAARCKYKYTSNTAPSPPPSSSSRSAYSPSSPERTSSPPAGHLG